MVNVNIHQETQPKTENSIKRFGVEEGNPYDVLSIAPEVDIFLHPMQTEALMKLLEDYKANNYMQTVTQCDIEVLPVDCVEF